jgi:FixJ family two-component response regulator
MEWLLRRGIGRSVRSSSGSTVIAPPPATHVERTRSLPIGANPFISIVDDDESVRESLPDLLGSFGYEARAFASAEAFLSSGCIDSTRCLVLDIAMPGMSGPELYTEILRIGSTVPVVFITANATAELCGRLRKQGAVACLSKPLDPDALVSAIQCAL